MNGLFVNAPTVRGLHFRRCAVANGLNTEDPDVIFIEKTMSINVEAINLESESPSKKLKPAEVTPRNYVDTKLDMKMLTKELSMKNLPALPDAIWMDVKKAMDTKHGETGWSGLRKEQVCELVRKTRSSMGHGNTISTVETMYNTMTDSPRAFLHASLLYAHPDPKKEEDNKGMRIMIFGNPSLFGLLELPGVDMFIDATFSCCPDPFKQCLIIMVYDHSTRSYVPVLYILMTHKTEHLYKIAFSHVVALSDWKIGVRTYTSDFERGLMNGLKFHFGGKKGSAVHIGCLFHLKQAWRKYLIQKVEMNGSSVKLAMETCVLDLLTIIPREEVREYGIPYCRSVLEDGQPSSIVKLWDIFWAYFETTWMPILSSWNICSEDDEYIDFVNRTNNGLESYNKHINKLYPKQPGLIEFMQTLEKETLRVDANLTGIRRGQISVPTRREPLSIPPLPAAYLQFKQDMVSQSQSKKKKASTKKTKKAAAVGTTTDSTTTTKKTKTKKAAAARK